MTRVVGAASRTTAASGAIPSRRSGSERVAPGVVTPEASLLHAGLLQGPGLATSPSPHAGRQPLRHLRHDVVEGPAHGARQRRGIAVGDPDPGAERALEEVSAPPATQRDREPHVGGVHGVEHLLECHHVDVQRRRPGIIRQPEPGRLPELRHQRALHVMRRQVVPAALLVEPVLHLRRPPYDALAEEGGAAHPAEADRDPRRGRRGGSVTDRPMQGRGVGLVEARRVAAAKHAAPQQRERGEEPRQILHRPFTGTAPSVRGPRRSALGSRSSESASVRTDSSASRSATRLACSSSRASPTPAAASPTLADASRIDAVVAPSFASSIALSTRAAAARSSCSARLKEPSSAWRDAARRSIDPRVGSHSGTSASRYVLEVPCTWRRSGAIVISATVPTVTPRNLTRGPTSSAGTDSSK